jgi:DNA-directed RNA polymerase subunit RPC12/RpoP
MECPICLVGWHDTECIPKYFILIFVYLNRMLNCGHSYCTLCVKGLYSESSQSISCPYCCQKMIFKGKAEVESLVKNFTLISLVQKQTSLTNNMSKTFDGN